MTAPRDQPHEDPIVQESDLRRFLGAARSPEGDLGLIGVVAPKRRRRELFRMTIDITPGCLPRKQPRFAFLDPRESLDGDA